MKQKTITEEIIVKIPMDDSPWSVQVSKESDSDVVFVCLFWNDKSSPTHVSSMTLEEFDAMYNKIRG